jgi:hypothetical protein
MSVFKNIVSLGRSIKNFLGLRKKIKSQFGKVGSSLRRFGAALVETIKGQQNLDLAIKLHDSSLISLTVLAASLPLASLLPGFLVRQGLNRILEVYNVEAGFTTDCTGPCAYN